MKFAVVKLGNSVHLFSTIGSAPKTFQAIGTGIAGRESFGMIDLYGLITGIPEAVVA
jgi:hypothetical protein